MPFDWSGIATHIGVAIVFVWAWSQERQERQALQRELQRMSQEYEERVEQLYKQALYPPKITPPIANQN